MSFELKRKLEYSDLQVTPDDGKRYELVRGELHVTPSPTPLHQLVSLQLVLQLVDFFHGRAIGRVLYAPVDLILTNHDVFVPDILVIGDRSGVTRRGIEKRPLLIVEILSPSTSAIDHGVKARRYAELGVPHYWIVDPERKRLECHRLRRGTYRPLVEAEGDAVLTHPDWVGLRLDLAALWR